MLRLNGQFNINADVVRGDKSIGHRALILASIARGQSVIRNLTLSRDILATIDCLRTLGADITLNGNTATVEPVVNPRDNVTLNCENSGTTARLLAGLVAGLGINAKFVGDESLVKRPMDRVLDPLKQMGANVCKVEDGLFALLGGVLHGGKIFAKVNSAQVKSAVLIAGLFAEGKTTYVENTPTRNHTEIMLSAMGADVKVNKLATTVCKSRLNPLDIDIPRDISSTSFLIALSAICQRRITCCDVLLNERRTGFLRAIARSGAKVYYKNERLRFGEKVGDITVDTSCLKPLNVSIVDVCDGIDELPVLAVIAIAVKGKHVFRGVSELKFKESDRIRAIESMARACNQQAVFDGENLTIVSDGKLPQNPRFVSFADHRIAMSEVTLCLVAGGGSVDETPFDVSFPEFCQALNLNVYKLGLIGSNVQNSRSPALMEYLATQSNVSCSYTTVNLPKDASYDELANVIARYDGLNVTMPFKARVASLLDADCLSVNTVGKCVRPQSTDGYGIAQALRDLNVDIEGKPLWIVGAGGASVACIETLLKYNCVMQVFNRTQARAEQLTAQYNLSTDVTEPYGVLSFVPECEFEQSITLPNSVKFVLTASYKGRSGLKRQAIERGITYVDGLRMLYHQGAKSFALWTNTPVQDDYNGFERFLKTIEKEVTL